MITSRTVEELLFLSNTSFYEMISKFNRLLLFLQTPSVRHAGGLR